MIENVISETFFWGGEAAWRILLQLSDKETSGWVGIDSSVIDMYPWVDILVKATTKLYHMIIEQT